MAVVEMMTSTHISSANGFPLGFSHSTPPLCPLLIIRPQASGRTDVTLTESKGGEEERELVCLGAQGGQMERTQEKRREKENTVMRQGHGKQHGKTESK